MDSKYKPAHETLCEESILCYIDFEPESRDTKTHDPRPARDTDTYVRSSSTEGACHSITDTGYPDDSSPYSAALCCHSRAHCTRVKKRSWGNAAKKCVFTRRLADAALHATQIIQKGREQWEKLWPGERGPRPILYAFATWRVAHFAIFHQSMW